MALAAVILLPVICAGGAAAYLLLRHFWLAFLVAISPLPGLAATLTPGLTLNLTIAPLQAAFGYVLAWTLALLVADDFVLRLPEGVATRAAIRAAVTSNMPVWLALLATTCLATLGAASVTGNLRTGVSEAISIVLPALSSGLVLLCAPALRYDEESIARLNRAREFLERQIGFAVSVTRARWAYSVSGIAIVLAAIAFFGAKGLPLEGLSPVVLAAILAIVVLLMAGLSWAVTRDLRAAAGLFLALVLVALVAPWGEKLAGAVLDSQTLLHLFFGYALSVAPLLGVAAQIRAYMKNDKDSAVAIARALLRYATGAAISTLGAAISLAIYAVLVQREVAAFLPMILVGGIAAIFFAPAFTIAVENLLPRSAAIEARYRVR